MASLSQAKTYGGIGSILVLLAIIPYAGWVIAIAGLVLTVIAVKYIGDVVQDASIFKNMVIGIGLAIGGVIVAGVIVFAALLRTIGNLANLSSLTTSTTIGSSAASNVLGFALTALAGLAILWILLIVSAIFVRKSYGTIAQHLNVGMFKTAALIYLIGAILTVIGIGLIIVFVAQILLVVAFFSISENRVTAGAVSSYPPPPSTMNSPGSTQSRTCPKCGAPLAADSVFCSSCGSNISQ